MKAFLRAARPRRFDLDHRNGTFENTVLTNDGVVDIAVPLTGR